MMPIERIDRDWITQHAATTLVFHANMGDRHLLQRRVIDRRDGRPTGLRYADTSYKRTKRNGDRGGTSVRTWSVEGHDQALATLDEALEILHIQRLGALPDEARG